MGSISSEEFGDSDADTTSTPSVTSQAPKRKGPQGGNLVKDMYKMFDGSALVTLGKLPPIDPTSVTHCGAQVFLSTSTSNSLSRETVSWALKRIPNRRS